MTAEADSLGRIAKLFIDRDNMSLEKAQKHLADFRVVLRCGPEVRRSAILQAAVLTALNIANRCFPGGVRVEGVDEAPVLLPWPGSSKFCDALRDIGGQQCIATCDATWEAAITVAFGTVEGFRHGVQATYDGWSFAISPIAEHLRLPEREGCVLSGVAAGALAVSEVFLGHFGCAIEAGSRVTGLSLWRPDLPWDALEAAGIDTPIGHLPAEVWLLGLGHLGQAFAWTFSMLPFSDPAGVDVMLQDYDRVVQANLDTGVVSFARHLGQLKTRVVNEFLEARGFRTRLIERRFDERTMAQLDEPRIMLAGMDGKGPRHLLDQAGFDLVIDCGLGGGVTNFDSITMNVVPNPAATAAQLWPSDDEARMRREEDIERLAASCDLYKMVQKTRGCGQVELAGRSIAVPFVGAISSTIAIAELLRRLMGATQFDRVRLQLASPDELSTLAALPSRLRAPAQPAIRDKIGA